MVRKVVHYAFCIEACDEEEVTNWEANVKELMNGIDAVMPFTVAEVTWREQYIIHAAGGPEIDNRDSGETWVTYRDYPGVSFRISLEFVKQLLQNAEENNPKEGQ
jgi:hypothetical protein